MSSAPKADICDGDTVGRRTELLQAILNETGASEVLQQITEDYDDDSIVTLSKFKPDRIAIKYGIPHGLAVAFVERCLVEARAQRDASSISSMTSLIGFSPTPAFIASPADDASLLRKLNLEVVCELGRGGFGRVYKCKNLADKLIVAVKLVNNVDSAKEAVREGQRLRRAKHKNIVLMHKVHDLIKIRGINTCALEMEAVDGGDLFKHMEAARRRPEMRLPHDAVLRFSRQLLEALVYLHYEMKWLHGDIKPQNILMQCSPIPFDGSIVDYSSAEIKLADFGLAKVMDQQDSSSSFMLTNASTRDGMVKGTMWYLSPEALQGASGGYDRSYTDDLWSACLVIYEMDTGLTLQQLMTAPGAVKLDELLTKASPELLPLLCSVLLLSEVTSRCASAAELLRKLDANIDPLFLWQYYDSSKQVFVPVHPAASFALEQAFTAGEPAASLPLKPPLDLNFDLQALLTSPTALGYQTERKSGVKRPVRRLLKPSVLTSCSEIPIWQEFVDEREWLQCSPSICAKLEIEVKDPITLLNTARYRHMVLNPSSIGSLQLPHSMKSEPYLTPANADDISMFSKRVHDSLAEWDITEAFQIVNPSLASKFAAHRYHLAARCNGNPNERILFHLASDSVISKIWQAGEGFESRLAQWAEVGKGAYFCENIMYNYAYKFKLWTPPDKFETVPEPPIGEKMRVFAVLVCLGNVADMGPGCESCPSPAFIEWKNEYNYQKSASNPNPLPTRPPAILLPLDAAERQHVLDLNQVKDEPRHDSVMSTEGDLATHPASTCKIHTGEHMRDVLHPRLKARANEWGKQYVLFDTASSYPNFLLTLTKTRYSPMGLQQLMDAGCDVKRIQSLGFTANDVKALGKSVREMRDAGWALRDLKAADFDAGSLLAGGFSVSELKSVGLTASQLRDSGCSARLLKDGGFNATELLAAAFDLAALDAAEYSFDELKAAGFGYAELAETTAAASAGALKHSIISVKDSTPQAIALAKVFFNDIQFASQLCSEFAAVYSSNAALSSSLADARDTLDLIVQHNTLLKSWHHLTSDRPPAWPRHDALLRFDLPLQRLTKDWYFTQKWFPRFFSLRGHFLYYSDGKNGYPDTRDGTLAFVQSNPAPDGRYCVDLKGCSVVPCTVPVDGQEFAFEIKFASNDKSSRDVFLAADDDITRQRCLQIMQIACAGNTSSTLQSIASTAALTRNLFCLKSVAAISAVLAALRVDMTDSSLRAVNFDFSLLKEFHFEARELRAVGFNCADLQDAGFNARELKAAGYDVLYDFEPKELCSMLRKNNGEQIISCNNVKEICANMRKGSASAKACMQEALSNGLLLLMFTCAVDACNAVDAKLEACEDGTTEPSNHIKEAQSICLAIHAVASLEIFDENTTLPLPDATNLCKLSIAVCSLWKNCHYIDTDSADGKLIFVNVIMNLALSLTQAFLFFETHPQSAAAMAWEYRGEIYDSVFSDKQFLVSLLMVCRAKPRTQWAYVTSRIIRHGTNFTQFCNSFGDSEVEGVRHVLLCIQSTAHSIDALRNFLEAMRTFSSQTLSFAELVVRNQALSFLQAVCVHDDLSIALAACSCICTLAAEKQFADVVYHSEAILVVQDILRSITPGSLYDDTQLSPSDMKALLTMMSPGLHPALHLCALHMVAKSFRTERDASYNWIAAPLQGAVKVVSTVFYMNSFRSLALSVDPFVYSAAIYILRLLHMPVPNYRPSKVDGTGNAGKIPVQEWSVEMVLQWVGSKSFSMYRHVFRDGLVDGRVLLGITDVILEQNKITNILHRQSILFAIQNLREASEALISGRTDSIEEVGSMSCDIFISFRPRGGSEIAQLLKVHFKSLGLEVFISEHNLLQDAARPWLFRHMGGAKNVILLLTKGCMDRFLDDAEKTFAEVDKEDLLRHEYHLALKLKKNLVLVAHEAFEWPNRSRLPKDVEAIMDKNVVKYHDEYVEASIQKIMGALLL